MGSTAQFKSFGPYFRSGALVTTPRLFHYLPGTSSLKDAWLERTKMSTAAQPIVGNANGVVGGFFDGLYKIVVTLSDELTVLETWDNFDITEDEHRLEGSLVWNPGVLDDGDSEASSNITVTGAAFGDFVLVAAPYDLLGISCFGYVSAANTVKIRLRNETSINGLDLASGTWRVRVLQQ
jgi:hypothetical protein